MEGKESAEHPSPGVPHTTAHPSRGLHHLLSAQSMPMRDFGFGWEDLSLEAGVNTDHPPSVEPSLIT